MLLIPIRIRLLSILFLLSCLLPGFLCRGIAILFSSPDHPFPCLGELSNTPLSNFGLLKKLSGKILLLSLLIPLQDLLNPADLLNFWKKHLKVKRL